MFNTGTAAQTGGNVVIPEAPLMETFSREDFGAVRVMRQGLDLWFVAKDVAEALGYPDSTMSNMSRLCQHVPEEWKGRHPIPTLGGDQEMLCLSEQGLYFFLGRSDKPKALPYQKWIAGDVIPSINRYGLYATPLTVDAMIADPDTAITLLKTLKEERRARAEAEEAARIEAERADFYKQTKAQIGSRREATAMATASAATRKVIALEDKLGEGQNYKQTKAIPWLLDEFEESRAMYQQVGKKLKSLSDLMGYKVLQVPCHEYPEGVKAYHVDVIDAFWGRLRTDLNMLGKYRKRGVPQ